MNRRYRRSLAAALLCLAGTLFAQKSIEKIEHTVSVEIDVPRQTDMLQVIDVGGWSGRLQHMTWDHASQTLSPLRKQLYLKSGGCIKVKRSGVARLTNSTGFIPLSVFLHDWFLADGVGTEVVIPLSSGIQSGRMFDLRIEAGANRYTTPGLYQGSIALLFESELGVDCR